MTDLSEESRPDKVECESCGHEVQPFYHGGLLVTPPHHERRVKAGPGGVPVIYRTSWRCEGGRKVVKPHG